MTTAAELNELAVSLAKATAEQVRLTAALDQHIAKKAKEIGDARGVEYAKAAREQIDEITRKAKGEIQRRDDCIAEMRRQMTHLDRIATQHKDLMRRINELAGQAHKLGEGVPAAVLHAAIANARNAAYATSTKEN